MSVQAVHLASLFLHFPCSHLVTARAAADGCGHHCGPKTILSILLLSDYNLGLQYAAVLFLLPLFLI